MSESTENIPVLGKSAKEALAPWTHVGRTHAKGTPFPGDVWNIKGENPMRKRHWEFVDRYIESFNVTKAGSECGYSESHAGRIFRRPDVQQAIHARRMQLVDKSKITVETLLEELRIIAFHPIEVGIVSAADKIKAIDLLGRYLGIWQGAGETTEVHTQKIILIDQQKPREIVATQNGSA